MQRDGSRVIYIADQLKTASLGFEMAEIASKKSNPVEYLKNKIKEDKGYSKDVDKAIEVLREDYNINLNKADILKPSLRGYDKLQLKHPKVDPEILESPEYADFSSPTVPKNILKNYEGVASLGDGHVYLLNKKGTQDYYDFNNHNNKLKKVDLTDPNEFWSNA